MAFNVLFNVGFYTTNYVFGLLLLARLLIFAMSAVCIALFVVPAKNQVNRRTGISGSYHAVIMHILIIS